MSLTAHTKPVCLELPESSLTPASYRRMKRCGWVGQEGEEEGGITHLTKTHFFWFPYLLYYWLLAKWSFRSSAYSNRRKLNINNRLFPSRVLFVNKGYKWNKAGKTISTPCSWFSGTWSSCSFPQPSLGLQMPGVLHTCLCGHPYKYRTRWCLEILVLWRGSTWQFDPSRGLFQSLSKTSSEPLMLWLQKMQGQGSFEAQSLSLFGEWRLPPA